MIYKDNFCRNIKVLRKTNNLSKKEMAKRLEIGIQTLNIIENGELPKRLTVKIIYTIVDKFNLKPSDLFE